MTQRVFWREANRKETHAFNAENDFLGILRYERVGAHMHWCWYQEQDIRMSPGCLQEVRDTQKALLRNSEVESK